MSEELCHENLIDSFVAMMKDESIDDETLWDIALSYSEKLGITLSEFCKVAHERYAKNLAERLGSTQDGS